MRDRIPNPEDAAKQASVTFWTLEYLAERGFEEKMEWFEDEIQPAIAPNYIKSR